MSHALLLIAGGAVAYLSLVFLLQRRVLFPAPAVAPDPGAAERVSLDTPVGQIEAFLVTPDGTGPFPLFLFAHGNGETADLWIDEFDAVTAWGWSALLVEYPGYGRSEGSPSQASVHATMLAAYAWALGDPRIDSDRLVGYGRSLGGAAVAGLATERRLAGLILESSFTSVRPLAARMLVPSILVRDPFDNLQALEGYHGPLLVLHGIEDEIIPVAHGRTLAASVPGAELQELPCGHNDCPRPWGLIRSFLERHGL